MITKKIIITGADGQDGKNLISWLLGNTKSDEYEILGTTFGPLSNRAKELAENQRVKFRTLNLERTDSITELIQDERPDYFINLGGRSSPRWSWENPQETIDVNGRAVISILEAIRFYKKDCRFFSAGSSEELSPYPSPYSLSKTLAKCAVVAYRSTFSLYAVHGTLFNHTSPESNPNFVVPKISSGVARIFNSLKRFEEFHPIQIDNIHSERDWSDSRDIVSGIWAMLNQNPGEVKDYHLCSGNKVSIKTIIEKCFRSVGMAGEWKADGYYIPSFLSKAMSLKSNCLVISNVEVNPPLPPSDGDRESALKGLGWSTRIPLDITLESMVNFYLKNEKSLPTNSAHNEILT